MVQILREKKASEKVINKFSKDTTRIQIPFQSVVGAIKKREGANWEKRKITAKRESLVAKADSAYESNSPARNGSPNPKSINRSKTKLSFVTSEQNLNKAADFEEASQVVAKKSKTMLRIPD